MLIERWRVDYNTVRSNSSLGNSRLASEIILRRETVLTTFRQIDLKDFMIKHFCQQIEGWFDFPALYRTAVADCPENGLIVEVGSYLGKSTAFMAVEIINSNKPIRFFCVDTDLQPKN
ncbi:hypothetical protein C5Y96_23735 [Blastopirellula marina]|uniref:Uncharacterized protein n=1 Tax=Blastopirellula marina TaxID=124 RepID=A0A2S8F0Y1_9BACT|nr:hypothetical protein C5Y96_23735 [Blastopirellula marina]RCS43504.1 hypothetical protein DTL36_23785 [Bremerella cremea]